MTTRVEPGLVVRMVKAKGEELLEHLRQQTVFFAISDERTGAARLIGTGVAADLQGTNVVFTAGHVLRAMADELPDEKVFLSVNRSRGSFRLRRHTRVSYSSGGDRGADAGIVIFADTDAASYFNFGRLDALVRASTVKAEMPPVGLECFIAGFPARLSNSTIEVRERTAEVIVASTMMITVSEVVEVDALHAWLWAGVQPLDIDTDQPVDMESLNGMSGGGCWGVERDDAAQELKLFLWGVHTATVGPRLRETPMIHHLRLLAGISTEMREKVSRLWPAASL